jgi:multidrug efflux pump subunit AcrA (membrane-fusion protein)
MNELGSGSSTDPPVTTDRSIAMQPLAARGPIAVQDKLLSMLHQNRDYALVRAPFNGVITQHKVGVGSLVHRNASTGAFMFEVMQRDVIRAFVCVPQDAAFGVAPGVDVIVRIPKIPNREFLGNVTRIADALQSGTPTLLTEIDIPSPDNALAPGAYCPVELTIPRPTPSFVVPAEAIIFNRNGLQLARVTTARPRSASSARRATSAPGLKRTPERRRASKLSSITRSLLDSFRALSRTLELSGARPFPAPLGS